MLACTPAAAPEDDARDRGHESGQARAKIEDDGHNVGQCPQRDRWRQREWEHGAARFVAPRFGPILQV